MDAFPTRYPERRIRSLTWIGIAALLILAAAIAYQWLGP
jgi:hypothetical protein